MRLCINTKPIILKIRRYPLCVFKGLRRRLMLRGIITIIMWNNMKVLKQGRPTKSCLIMRRSDA